MNLQLPEPYNPGVIDLRVLQRKGYLSRDLRDEHKFIKEGQAEGRL